MVFNRNPMEVFVMLSFRTVQWILCRNAIMKMCFKIILSIWLCILIVFTFTIVYLPMQSLLFAFISIFVY